MSLSIPSQSPYGKPETLISDHYPQRNGDTVSWNIDKKSDLKDVAKSIAHQLHNHGDINAHLLQEVPHGRQQELIHNIRQELYKLNSPVKLDYSYQQNGTQPFGNMILHRTPALSDVTLALNIQRKLDELNKVCQPQALVKPLIDRNGKLRLMVNVHAEKDPSVRIKLKEVFKSANELLKECPPVPGCEITIGGDFNAGTKALPTEIAKIKNQGIDTGIYKHSAAGSNYVLRNGRQEPSAVDAFFSLGNTSILPQQPLEKMTQYNQVPAPVKKWEVLHHNNYSRTPVTRASFNSSFMPANNNSVDPQTLKNLALQAMKLLNQIHSSGLMNNLPRVDCFQDKLGSHVLASQCTIQFTFPTESVANKFNFSMNNSGILKSSEKLLTEGNKALVKTSDVFDFNQRLTCKGSVNKRVMLGEIEENMRERLLPGDKNYEAYHKEHDFLKNDKSLSDTQWSHRASTLIKALHDIPSIHAEVGKPSGEVPTVTSFKMSGP